MVERSCKWWHLMKGKDSLINRSVQLLFNVIHYTQSEIGNYKSSHSILCQLQEGEKVQFCYLAQGTLISSTILEMQTCNHALKLIWVLQTQVINKLKYLTDLDHLKLFHSNHETSMNYQNFYQNNKSQVRKMY